MWQSQVYFYTTYLFNLAVCYTIRQWIKLYNRVNAQSNRSRTSKSQSEQKAVTLFTLPLTITVVAIQQTLSVPSICIHLYPSSCQLYMNAMLHLICIRSRIKIQKIFRSVSIKYYIRFKSFPLVYLKTIWWCVRCLRQRYSAVFSFILPI